jgi:hypothetical protein
MSKKLMKLLSIPLLLSAAACARNTTETVRSVSDYCLIAKGITYSEAHGTQGEDSG